MTKEKKDLIIRQATPNDADFIARTVMTAMDMKLKPGDSEWNKQRIKIFESLIECAKMEKSLYSYNNTIIAEVNGETAGALISYPGVSYRGFRVHTFAKMYEDTGIDLTFNPFETKEGEYYFDCMMVHMKYRRKGIATRLLEEGYKKATDLGYNNVHLLAKVKNTKLCSFYFKQGFMRELQPIHIFDDDYYKFVKFLFIYK